MIIDLNILILRVNAKILNPIAELATPTGTPAHEANLEIETYPLTAGTKTRNCSK